MSKHIEMIEDYIIRQSKDTDYNPPSYEWSDNHGILTRCRDCRWFEPENFDKARCICRDDHGIDRGLVTCNQNDFCSYAVRKDPYNVE